uniref:Rab-GAP TBC domain-containing protein n=1 Tax=Elaeophora elaphi TaxID=1147741 RepID=A0A0R3RKN5_9BILA
ENSEKEEKVSFKRGHRRRSSYESAQIQLTYHSRRPSFHRNIHWINNKSLTTPGSFINSNTATTNGAMTATIPTIATAGTAHDSAIGESLSSKRSSLDRRSELSAGIIRDGDVDSVDDEDRDSDDDNGFSNMDSTVDDRMRKRSKKGGRNALSLLSSAFARKLFSRNRQHEHQHTNSWRIFGSKQWKNSGGIINTSTTTDASCSATDDICCSTTGLILEDRPSTLPAKSVAEQRRHEAQYLALIEATKRQEARRVRQRQQLIEMKRKEEDETAAAAEVWCSRILPNWENMKDSKHCRDLWWRGIPSKVRGHVWSLAFGNELNLTPELYEICVARARQHAFATTMTAQCGASGCSGFLDVDQRVTLSIFPKVICFSTDNDMEKPIGRESTLELIHLDVSRTFPHLGFFQKGGPYEELLLDLLGAYVCYRPDIGYVQSMCFLAAMILLQIHQPYQSFQAFANLLNRPLMLAFFGLRQPQMTVYFIAYDQYFEQELPKLHHHFDVLDVRPDMVYTLYAKSLPFDVCCRVWDVFLRDGEQFVFSTALGIMHLYECELENMDDFDAVVHFLTHLPESMNVNQLFDAIEPFMKSSAATLEHGNGKKRSFQQIHSDVSERIAQAAVMADGNGKSGLFLSPMDILYQNGEPSNRGCGGGSCKSAATNDIAKNSCNAGEQQAATLRLNASNMKMSKSLSEFVDDLLRGASTREGDMHADVFPKSRAPTAV